MIDLDGEQFDWTVGNLEWLKGAAKQTDARFSGALVLSLIQEIERTAALYRASETDRAMERMLTRGALGR